MKRFHQLLFDPGAREIVGRTFGVGCFFGMVSLSSGGAAAQAYPSLPALSDPLPLWSA